MQPLAIERVRRSRVQDVDLLKLEFSAVFSDHMLVARFRNGVWGPGAIVPYGPIELPIHASSLQYGVSVFEGLKAHRTPYESIAIFRPDANLRRLNRSAARLAMPAVPEDLFRRGLRQLVELDAAWVPPVGAGALYLRPCLLSTDPSMRVRPAEEFLFAIVASPFGAYYAAPLDLLVTDRFVRAFPGGTGDIKPGGNYAPAMLADRDAQARGCGTVLWLDGMERRYVEECGAMNIFFVVDDTVLTPALSGTILPGVTRDSVLCLLRDRGWRVEERRIAIDEVVAWHEQGRLRECFGTGTAAIVTHILSIQYRDHNLGLPAVGDRKVGPMVREALVAIMTGAAPDPYSWLELVEASS
jgi:branched-chain amino acid aminotransferase